MAGDANGWVPMLVAVDTLSLLDDLVSEMDPADMVIPDTNVFTPPLYFNGHRENGHARLSDEQLLARVARKADSGAMSFEPADLVKKMRVYFSGLCAELLSRKGIYPDAILREMRRTSDYYRNFANNEKRRGNLDTNLGRRQRSISSMMHWWGDALDSFIHSVQSYPTYVTRGDPAIRIAVDYLSINGSIVVLSSDTGLASYYPSGADVRQVGLNLSESTTCQLYPR